MSYCVECGVELDAAAKKCPLCATQVINPNKMDKQEVQAPFSQEKFIPKEVRTRFVAGIVTLVMAIPALVCFLLNAVFFTESSWSLYVVATAFLTWTVFVVPFFFKSNRTYFMWGFDTLASALYVYSFSGVEGFGKALFLSCALPIILINSSMILIYIIWVKHKKRHSILKALFIFSLIALSCFTSGLILDVEGGIAFASEVGIIVSLCIIAVVIFLALCYRSKAIRRWLSKRLFV